MNETERDWLEGNDERTQYERERAARSDVTPEEVRDHHAWVEAQVNRLLNEAYERGRDSLASQVEEAEQRHVERLAPVVERLADEEKRRKAAEAQVEDLRKRNGELTTGSQFLTEKLEDAEADVADLRSQLEAMGYGRTGWPEVLELERRCKAAEQRAQRLEEARDQAEYALHPNQGETPDPSLASQWLRTTFPLDHPNYVDPAKLASKE